MELLVLTLLVASLDSSWAVIWLTINEHNESYSTGDQAATRLTILCHQRTSENNISLWIDRVRSISKKSGTYDNVWNITFERPELGFPNLYVDRRRSTEAYRVQLTQYYYATGYTIIYPITSDSGIYRCQGGVVSSGTIIPEVSEAVTLVVRRDADPTTIITFNDDESPVVVTDQIYSQAIRCHTFISDTTATVLYHIVFKAQNLTQRNIYGEIDVAMTDWMEIFRMDQNIFESDVESRRISDQDLTSGFDLHSPGYTDSGLYFCSAVYNTSVQERLTVNSSVVYLDVRGSASVMLAIAPVGFVQGDTVCRFGNDLSLENSYICQGIEYDYLIAVCDYYGVDFIPEIELTVGNVSKEIHDHVLYESTDYAGSPDLGPFHAMQFDGKISKIFYASEICDFPEISCSAALPGSPERTRRRTAILISEFCENWDSEFLKSKGKILQIPPSMFFICLTAAILSPWYLRRRTSIDDVLPRFDCCR